MRKDIQRKCENCTLCQARSTAGKKIIAPLQTINVGLRFSEVAADILGPVTRAKASGAKYILVLTDYFTKYVVCVPLERTTAEDVARAIVENWVLTFGAPDCLHTDQGANFCSELLLEVCKIFGIEKTRTSPYQPQWNGIVEPNNKLLRMLFPKTAQTIQVAGIKWFPISTSSIIRPYTKQQDRIHSHTRNGPAAKIRKTRKFTLKKTIKLLPQK